MKSKKNIIDIISKAISKDLKWIRQDFSKKFSKKDFIEAFGTDLKDSNVTLKENDPNKPNYLNLVVWIDKKQNSFISLNSNTIEESFSIELYFEKNEDESELNLVNNILFTLSSNIDDLKKMTLETKDFQIIDKKESKIQNRIVIKKDLVIYKIDFTIKTFLDPVLIFKIN